MVLLFSQENINNIPSSKTIISAAATITATAVVLRTITNDLLPTSLRHHFSASLRRLSNHFSSHLTVVIDDFSDDNLTANLMFDAANTYLSSKLSPSTKRIKVTKPPKETSLTITIDKNQEIIDCYDGAHLAWISQSTCVEKSNSSPKNKNSGGGRRNLVRSFELSFHKRHREMVLRSYLPYVLRKAEEIKEGNKTLKLHTIDYNGTDYWGWTRLDHPATFESMAMELETKDELIEDLDLFLTRKEYYRRVGKAWKRGYLLFGPPGTGKSSLVAAMANYLKFDVYDLDLREVQCNSDLRRLLIGVSNRSILVIEDIDCSVELQNRSLEKEASNVEDDKVTLSGLLNFIDGLWSSCGDERIIVFTTNHKDRLDPALLRPGRMDVHIEMSYCSFSGFKILAVNYLYIQEHPAFEEIEKLIAKAQVTPAEVAGELMKRKDTDSALKGFIKFLQSKKDNIDMKT